MSSHQKFKEKYPVSNWVLNSNNIEDHDILVWLEDGVEQRGTFEGVPSGVGAKTNIIAVKRLSGQFDLIDLYDTIVYRLEGCAPKPTCACGAIHTSNPKYHMSYCPADGFVEYDHAKNI